MKLQYLGDSKDCFKWDYHDFLTSLLGYSKFNIALMMTPDDGGNDGQTHPSRFPARPEVISFCHDLRKSRSIETIGTLPAATGASYKVSFHNGGDCFDNYARYNYFSGFENSDDQLVFLDPDNGFEPEKSCNEKHVRYADLSRILDQLSDNSVVSVFQHFRRVKFPEDYSRIKSRIEFGFSTAIYWHSLMFVVLSKSEKTLDRVNVTNQEYAKINPVKIII